MRRRTDRVVLGLIISGIAFPAGADGNSRSAGIATSACSFCHRLPDGSGAVFGPSFEAIARKTALSPAALEGILGKPPHARVVQVDPERLADLAAWLNSLGEP